MKVSVIAVTSRDRPFSQSAGVDAVREQIAGDAAAGDADVETPQPLAALRQVARDRPVLEELRAVVKDAPQLAFVDQLLEQHDRRHAAVVVPDHVGDAGAPRPADTIASRLGGVAAERLLAGHHLAGARRGDGDLVRACRSGWRCRSRSMSRRSTTAAPVGLGRSDSPTCRQTPARDRRCVRTTAFSTG